MESSATEKHALPLVDSQRQQRPASRSSRAEHVPLELGQGNERDLQPPSYYAEMGGDEAIRELDGARRNENGRVSERGRKSPGSISRRAELV